MLKLNKVLALKINEMLELLLPKFEYSLRKKKDKLEIYDIVRNKYVFLSPEEWVRQHFVHYLKNFKSVPINLISIEKSEKLNNLPKRTDIKVYDRNLNPVLLVECKSPMLSLSQDAFHQAIRYNQVVGAEYLCITNGLNTFYWKTDKGSGYIPMNDLPDKLID